MKYVRNVDDLKKYSFEFFDSFLSQTLSDQMVNFFLMDIGNKKELFDAVCDFCDGRQIGEKPASEYGEAILQVAECHDLLKNFVELLLKTKSFEALCAFLNKIFLQQIGPNKYKSSAKQYSIAERYFDRFVEIVWFCNISKELYTPFFCAILASEFGSLMFVYKEPLKEYLETHADDDSGHVLNEFVEENLTSSTQKSVATLKSLVYEFVKGNSQNFLLIKALLCADKQTSIEVLDEFLTETDIDVQLRLVQLLLMIADDKRAKDRLKKIYSSTTDEKIKQKLENECGFSSLKTFSSENEFLNFVDENVKTIQTRIYGLRLTKFFEAHNLSLKGTNAKVLTLAINTFQNKNAESNLIELRHFFKFANQQNLQALASVIWQLSCEKGLFWKSKWAVRLVCCFATNDLLNQITNQATHLILTNQNALGAMGFFQTLLFCGRDEAFEAIKNASNQPILPKWSKKFKTMVEKFSNNHQKEAEEVADKLVDSMGFDKNGSRWFDLGSRKVRAQINVDCSISLFNEQNKPARIKLDEKFDGKDFRNFLKSIQKNIKLGKKRLYQAFVEFRCFGQPSFETCILNNALLSFLAQHLFWARYKKDKLVEICVIRDGKLMHYAGNVLGEEAEQYAIAVLQPMDCREIWSKLRNFMPLLFDQFSLPVFLPQDVNQNSNFVDNLSGVFCNSKLFVTRLQKQGYKVGCVDEKGNFSSLVKSHKNLGLIVCVEFDEINSKNMAGSTTIFKVRFFDFEKQRKVGKKFALDKQSSLMVSSINPHVLSNELAQILLASKT